MRVLILTNLFADPWNPQSATFNQQQFARLSQLVDLKVLVPVSWMDVLRHPLAYGRLRRAAVQRWPFVDYVIFWYPPRLGRSLHSVFLFLSLLLQRFPTLFLRQWDCLMGSWACPDSVALAMVSRLRRLPLLVKLHGSDINVFAQERLRGMQIRWALREAHQIVAVSQALADRTVQLGASRARIEVLYNGVDPAKFHPVPRDEARRVLGLAGEKRLVLFVGNLKVIKGCDELLQAFARLTVRLPDLELALVGAGPLKASLENQARELGIAGRVRFVGRVAHEEVLRWFAASELLCLPSHDEGVPNVILEAMCCGRPVVASRVGGIPEVLPPEAGLMVTPRDVGGLEGALFTALSSKWDSAAIAAHAAGFNWDTNVARLRALLEQASRS